MLRPEYSYNGETIIINFGEPQQASTTVSYLETFKTELLWRISIPRFELQAPQCWKTNDQLVVGSKSIG